MGILSDIGEAIHDRRREHLAMIPYEPVLFIKFSYDGHMKAKADKDAMMILNQPWQPKKTVYGYPYTVDVEQEEDFMVDLKKQSKL